MSQQINDSIDYIIHLYKTSHKKLYQMSYHILLNELLAEEALHEAFLRIAKLEAHTEGVCLCELSASKIKQLLLLMVWYSSEKIYKKQSSGDNSSCSSPQRLNFQLPDIILNLPIDSSCSFLLKYGLGYANKSIAELLGLSLISVWLNLKKAKHILNSRKSKYLLNEA